MLWKEKSKGHKVVRRQIYSFFIFEMKFFKACASQTFMEIWIPWHLVNMQAWISQVGSLRFCVWNKIPCVTYATGPRTAIGLVKADSIEIQSKWFELCVYLPKQRRRSCVGKWFGEKLFLPLGFQLLSCLHLTFPNWLSESRFHWL